MDKTKFKCIGFLPLGDRQMFTDLADYADWFGRVWTRYEIGEELERGVLPPGLLIEREDGYTCCIVGEWGTDTMRAVPVDLRKAYND